MILAFTVYGVALPKGNLKPRIATNARGMHFPIVTESNKGVKSWQQLVKQGASEALNRVDELERRLLTEAVRVSATFVLPRPKSLARKVSAHTKAPDLDKLARAICDALTGVVYRDDNQVCELVIAKRYGHIEESAHVAIRVEPTAGIAPIVVPAAPLPLLELV